MPERWFPALNGSSTDSSARKRSFRRRSGTQATLRDVLTFEANHPIVTLPTAMEILGTTKPTAAKAIDALRTAKILSETTGKQRDRVYAYKNYLALLTGDTE